MLVLFTDMIYADIRDAFGLQKPISNMPAVTPAAVRADHSEQI